MELNFFSIIVMESGYIRMEKAREEVRVVRLGILPEQNFWKRVNKQKASF